MMPASADPEPQIADIQRAAALQQQLLLETHGFLLAELEVLPVRDERNSHVLVALYASQQQLIACRSYATTAVYLHIVTKPNGCWQCMQGLHAQLARLAYEHRHAADRDAVLEAVWRSLRTARLPGQGPST